MLPIIVIKTVDCQQLCYIDIRCSQSKVLVHCKMGISRSASTVMQLFLQLLMRTVKFDLVVEHMALEMEYFLQYVIYH